MRGEDMSILIKGMEMPETCDECKFHCYHSRGEYICVATPLFYPFNLANSKGIRKDWCPRLMRINLCVILANIM